MPLSRKILNSAEREQNEWGWYPEFRAVLAVTGGGVILTCSPGRKDGCKRVRILPHGLISLYSLGASGVAPRGMMVGQPRFKLDFQPLQSNKFATTDDRRGERIRKTSHPCVILSPGRTWVIALFGAKVMTADRPSETIRES